MGNRKKITKPSKKKKIYKAKALRTNELKQVLNNRANIAASASVFSLPLQVSPDDAGTVAKVESTRAQSSSPAERFKQMLRVANENDDFRSSMNLFSEVNVDSIEEMEAGSSAYYLNGTKQRPKIEEVHVGRAAICRCCRSYGGFETVKSCYYNEATDQMESYASLLHDTFSITLQLHAHSTDSDVLVCGTCAARLRDAAAFRQQVLQAESEWERQVEAGRLQVDGDEAQVEVAAEMCRRYSDSSDEKFEDYDVPINTIPQAKFSSLNILQSNASGMDQFGCDNKDPIGENNKGLKSAKNMKTLLVCPFCSEKFKNTYAAFSKHLKRNHGNKSLTGKRFGPIGCDACFFVSPDCKSRNRHVRKNHLTCKKCSKTFCNIYERDQHKRCTQCTKCRRSFKTLIRLNNHVAESHKICAACQQEFDTRSDYLKHKVEVHAASKYQCGVCSMFFITRKILDVHQRKVHMKERRVKCPKCSHITFDNHSLQKHMICHNNVKSYTCEYCMKKFARRTTLRVHERIHTGDKRQTCKLCGAAFVQRASLKYHLEKYHPE